MKAQSRRSAQGASPPESVGRPAGKVKKEAQRAGPKQATKERPSTSVLTLIEQVKQGRLRGADLANEDRGRCVEFLTAQGYSVPEISQVFAVCERTIYRDRREVRRANALRVDPGLAEELIGELYQFAEQSAQRLRRLARESATPPAAKVEAEKAAWTVIKERSELLQRVGHLPTAAHEVNARLTHSLSPVSSYKELAVETALLKSAIAADPAQTAELNKQVAELDDFVSRGVVSESLRSITRQLKEGRHDHRNS